MRAELDQGHETPIDEKQQAHLIPLDINERVRLMEHHHLCAGAFDSVVIILFGKFTDQYGLSQMLFILTS